MSKLLSGMFNCSPNKDNFLVIPSAIMRIFLQQEKPADLMALYLIYQYTPKWPEPNEPKLTVTYIAKKLKWSEEKVRKIRKQLWNLQEEGII